MYAKVATDRKAVLTEFKGSGKDIKEMSDVSALSVEYDTIALMPATKERENSTKLLIVSAFRTVT